ncbi:translesion error-prone DNA polymerase V autoproteolytic subunit [Dyadobacter sp. CY345]|uniref:LexA family protein n=1 Tax=Dyadobacter sp. CY345 TaxID=2909335 RepID=UPI001F2CA992|nr:translesion error-prone DNA polymerase V autoproteolytic subunit [Dyadobacter sp. CY345]MCF2443241.1 translesion error-prone DNA polymerase V autoproteolytic subunit [Dyadobacter sp. CY345]
MEAISILTSDNLELFAIEFIGESLLPLIPGISAGFPSPAADFIDVDIDLKRELIKNQPATFLGRVKGNSMIDAGIDDGDILIVDKSLPYKDNCIAVCFIDQEFTVKRILLEKDVLWLLPANEKYPPIKVTSESEFIIWGIVTYIIKSC